MLQARHSDDIRRDAINMGIKKARSGCTGCAETYFELAHTHGASEQEVQQALEEATQSHGKHFKRRDLVKILAAGVLALTTVDILHGQAHADQYGDWYGSDSNSTSDPIQQDFYIGRTGQALSPDTTPYAFDKTAAQHASSSRTFSYWAVHGPTSNWRPGGYSDYSWGAIQATTAFHAIGSLAYGYLIGGQTIFGQVEPETPGWDNGNITPNRDVVNGFLDKVFAITAAGVWPGLYITPDNWKNLLEPDFRSFRANTNFVLWLAGLDTCGNVYNDICGPCTPNCATQPTVHNRFQWFLNNGINLGSMVPVLWQYWIANCGCGTDGDVTRQNTSSFTPVVVAGAAQVSSSFAQVQGRKKSLHQ